MMPWRSDLVGRHLLGRLDGGVHVQAACVGFLAILGKDHLPHGFGQVFGMQNFFVRRRPQLERLRLWPALASAAEMYLLSSIRSMMYSWRERARLGLLIGL